MDGSSDDNGRARGAATSDPRFDALEEQLRGLRRSLGIDGDPVAVPHLDPAFDASSRPQVQHTPDPGRGLGIDLFLLAVGWSGLIVLIVRLYL